MGEKIRQFILIVGDVALLQVALFLALSLRYRTIIDGRIWSQHWPIFSIIFAIWLAIFYIAGFYSLANIRNDLKFYVGAGQALTIALLLAVVFFYISPTVYFAPERNITPKTILLLTAVIFLGLFTLWRRLIHRSLLARALKRRILMIGDNNTARELTGLLDGSPQLGYEIAAILPHDARDQIGNVPDYLKADELSEVIKKHRVSTIVMDNRSQQSPKLVDNLFRFLPKRLEFMSLDRFYENTTKRISLETIDQFWFLENLQEGNKRLYDLGKRTVDIIAAGLFGALSLLVTPLVALVMVVSSKGPILFEQIRLGKNGRPFRAIKFRTMLCDAEKHGPAWAQRNDPRVTRIGRFLRKTRLDEIPQLWNILKGEMSFVGPRPERPEFVVELAKTIPFYRERMLVKPGLTGWAQINFPYGASAADAAAKLQYDLYYIKNRSLVLDLAIILRTIKTVLSAIGR